jgi:hypothetical protein
MGSRDLSVVPKWVTWPGAKTAHITDGKRTLCGRKVGGDYSNPEQFPPPGGACGTCLAGLRRYSEHAALLNAFVASVKFCQSPGAGGPDEDEMLTLFNYFYIFRYGVTDKTCQNNTLLHAGDTNFRRQLGSREDYVEAVTSLDRALSEAFSGWLKER